jgi:Domain of unknown function (DUF397)
MPTVEAEGGMTGSDASGGGVEISFVDGSQVPIKHKHADQMIVMRNGKNPDGDALYYTPSEWEAFILGVKDGEFDDMVEDPAPAPE